MEPSHTVYTVVVNDNPLFETATTIIHRGAILNFLFLCLVMYGCILHNKSVAFVVDYMLFCWTLHIFMCNLEDYNRVRVVKLLKRFAAEATK